MVESAVTVALRSGLHARPAAAFVKLANQFKSDIYLRKQGRTANAKSILGILSLATTKGTEVVLIAEGDDEQEAITELIDFLKREDA